MADDNKIKFVDELVEEINLFHPYQKKNRFGYIPYSPPTNISLTGSVTSANIYWTGISAGADYYDIYRSTSPQTSFGLVGSATSSLTSFSDTNVSSSSTYYYQLKSRNNYGSSTASNIYETGTLDQEPTSQPSDFSYSANNDYFSISRQEISLSGLNENSLYSTLHGEYIYIIENYNSTPNKILKIAISSMQIALTSLLTSYYNIKNILIDNTGDYIYAISNDGVNNGTLLKISTLSLNISNQLSVSNIYQNKRFENISYNNVTNEILIIADDFITFFDQELYSISLSSFSISQTARTNAYAILTTTNQSYYNLNDATYFYGYTENIWTGIDYDFRPEYDNINLMAIKNNISPQLLFTSTNIKFGIGSASLSSDIVHKGHAIAFTTTSNTGFNVAHFYGNYDNSLTSLTATITSLSYGKVLDLNNDNIDIIYGITNDTPAKLFYIDIKNQKTITTLYTFDSGEYSNISKRCLLYKNNNNNDNDLFFITQQSPPKIIKINVINTFKDLKISFSGATSNPNGYLISYKSTTSLSASIDSITAHPINGVVYSQNQLLSDSTHVLDSITSTSNTIFPAELRSKYNIYSYNGDGLHRNYLINAPLTGEISLENKFELEFLNYTYNPSDQNEFFQMILPTYPNLYINNKFLLEFDVYIPSGINQSVSLIMIQNNLGNFLLDTYLTVTDNANFETINAFTNTTITHNIIWNNNTPEVWNRYYHIRISQTANSDFTSATGTVNIDGYPNNYDVYNNYNYDFNTLLDSVSSIYFGSRIIGGSGKSQFRIRNVTGTFAFPYYWNYDSPYKMYQDLDKTLPVTENNQSVAVIETMWGDFKYAATSTSSHPIAVNLITNNAMASEPSNQPTNISFSSITTSSVTISFSAATSSPEGYLIVYKRGSSITASPVDGIYYGFDSIFETSATGYTGTNATSYTLTGLLNATTHYINIYSFNGGGIYRNYNTTNPLTGSFITL